MRRAPDNPMDAASDEASRRMLAVALQEETDESREPLVVQVGHSLATLRRRSWSGGRGSCGWRLRRRTGAGDQGMLGTLMGEKLMVDRALREL